jgi:hypothetical protein
VPVAQWRFEPAVKSNETLSIALVRGEVERIDRAGPPLVTIASISGDASAVRFEMARDSGGWQIRDVYPQTSVGFAGMRECRAPMTDRGDFWQSDARFRIVVAAPAGMRVRVHVMDRP